MTIRKGEPWGDAIACPDDVAIVDSDRALGEWVTVHRRRGVDLPPVGVRAGDLARTCGGGTGLRPASARVVVDVVRLSIDGAAPVWFVAHVVARRRAWRGEVVMAMNAEYLGDWDVAPRSHPNDGRVDVLRVDASMPFRERLQARQRARTGSHLPHPHLVITPTRETQIDFQRAMDLWVDGAKHGRAHSIACSVEPDALVLYV